MFIGTGQEKAEPQEGAPSSTYRALWRILGSTAFPTQASFFLWKREEWLLQGLH